MKSKDKKELHLKSVKELNSLAEEAKGALAALKLDKAQNKLKNTSQLSAKRKEIAQMFTIMRLKELAEIQTRKKERYDHPSLKFRKGHVSKHGSFEG